MSSCEITAVHFSFLASPVEQLDGLILLHLKEHLIFQQKNALHGWSGSVIRTLSAGFMLFFSFDFKPAEYKYTPL